MSVWEEEKDGSEMRVFRIPLKSGLEKEEEREERKEKEGVYNKMRKLQEDFPNLKVGGLLPDPLEAKLGDATPDPLEWTVIVFPQSYGPWRRWSSWDLFIPVTVWRGTGSATPVVGLYVQS